MTAQQRFQAFINRILNLHKQEIEAAPMHFGLIVQNDAGDLNDGAEYEDRNPIPEFIRDDLKGWSEIENR